MRPCFIAAVFMCHFSPAAFGQANIPSDAANPSRKPAEQSRGGSATVAPSGKASSPTAARRIAPARTQALQTRVASPDSTDWRFAYPDATVRISIHLGRMLRAPMVAEAMKSAPGAMQAQTTLALKMLQGIEKIQLSIRQAQGTQPSRSQGSGSKDAEMLVLITGQIDPTLRQAIDQQGTANAMTARQIAPNVLLLGKNAQLESATKRMEEAPLTGELDGLSESDIWIGGDTAMVASMGNSASGMPGVDSLKRFSLGIDVGDPFGLSVNLMSANDAGADQLLSLYNLAVAANSSKTPAEFAPLLDRIRVEKHGSEIQFRFSAPVAMIQTAFAKSQALQNLGSTTALPAGLSGLLVGAHGGPATGSSATSFPHPEQPGKIMIYGLDEGPREVGAPR